MFRKLNEQLEKFLEDVVSFQDFKAKKELKQKATPNTFVFSIGAIKVVWAETDCIKPFKSGDRSSYREMQAKLFAADRLLKERNGYIKLKYAADILFEKNGETVKDTYVGRLDLGTGDSCICDNMVHFISDEVKMDVRCSNPLRTRNMEDEINVYYQEYLKECEPKEEPKPIEYDKTDYSKGDTKLGIDVEVGDIIYIVWGYSMKLVNFYKVIERKKSSVKLVELEHIIVDGDGMSGSVVPSDKTKASDVDGKLFRLGIKWDNKKVCKINGHYAEYWDGRPAHIDRWD